MLEAMILMLAAAGDPWARPRADAARYCEARHGTDAAAAANCTTAQKRELGNFVKMMAGFEDPAQATARRCMTSGRRGKFIDWTVASPCLRQAVKGLPVGSRTPG